MEKMTAKQKVAAVMQGASILNALVSAGATFSIKESARAKFASKMELAQNADVLLSLFWDDDDEEEAEAEYRVTDNGTAIIPVYGVMLDTAPSWWLSWFGATSTPQVTEWARMARADANVKRTFWDFDTPGGHAAGISTLADVAFETSAEGKPMWAYCREACSAGYFVASQADKIIARIEGDLGCIGTRILLRDYSQAFATQGIETVAITSTGAEEYKTTGAMGTVITPKQRDDLKRQCDESQTLFNAAIVRGRGVTPAKAQEWADGRYFMGYVAKEMGLADEIGDPDVMLAAFGEDGNGAKDPPPSDVDASEYEENRRKNNQYAVKSKTNPAKPAQTGTKSLSKLDELKDKVKTTLFGGNESADDKQDAAAHTIAELTTKNAELEAKNKELQDKVDGFEKTEREKSANALSAAKKSAKELALTAKGQGTPEYDEEVALIEAQTNPAVLATFARGYEAEAKTHGLSNTERTTTGNDPAVTSSADALAEQMAKVREEGEKVNGTGKAK